MPNKSRPQDWETTANTEPSATLAQDETVAMVMHFNATDKDGDQTHVLFTVVRKGDKAIAKNIMVHESSFGPMAAHAHKLAAYPIENELDLVKEVRNHGLLMAMMLANDPAAPVKLDPNGAVFFTQVPKSGTNAGLLENFNQDTQPEGVMAKRIITEVLGLKPKVEMTMKMSPKQNESMSDAQALAKAAIEQDLIKRFGKKKIVELAKKMDYKGVTINKSTKSHAN